MKQLFLIFALIFGMTIFAQSQQVNFPEGSLLVYSDTNTFVGGDVFIRSVYAFVPQELGFGIFEYQYKKIYKLNDEIIENDFITYTTEPYETLLISGQPKTYEWLQTQILTINVVNWEIATWQNYLQKIYNQ